MRHLLVSQMPVTQDRTWFSKCTYRKPDRPTPHSRHHERTFPVGYCVIGMRKWQWGSGTLLFKAPLFTEKIFTEYPYYIRRRVLGAQGTGRQGPLWEKWWTALRNRQGLASNRQVINEKAKVTPQVCYYTGAMHTEEFQVSGEDLTENSPVLGGQGSALHTGVHCVK